MNSALKAGILTLIIVAIGFGLMSFLGDDDGGPSDQGTGSGEGNSSVTEEVRTNNRLPDREILKSSISGIVRDDAGTPLPGAVSLPPRWSRRSLSPMTAASVLMI